MNCVVKSRLRIYDMQQNSLQTVFQNVDTAITAYIKYMKCTRLFNNVEALSDTSWT